MKSTEMKKTVFHCLVMALTLVVALPMPAEVSAQTFGDLAQRFMTGNLEFIPDLISALCYISGFLMIAQGVMKLKDHAENPTNVKIQIGIVRLIVGGTLVALPVVAGFVLKTLSLDGGSSAPPFQGLGVKMG